MASAVIRMSRGQGAPHAKAILPLHTNIHNRSPNMNNLSKTLAARPARIVFLMVKIAHRIAANPMPPTGDARQLHEAAVELSYTDRAYRRSRGSRIAQRRYRTAERR